MFRVILQHFLHPDHVEPRAEFIAAAVETADRPISEMRMEFTAVIVKKWKCLSFLRHSDACIQIADMHFLENVFERLVELPAESLMAKILIQINGRLHRILICLAADKR